VVLEIPASRMRAASFLTLLQHVATAAACAEDTRVNVASRLHYVPDRHNRRAVTRRQHAADDSLRVLRSRSAAICSRDGTGSATLAVQKATTDICCCSRTGPRLVMLFPINTCRQLPMLGSLGRVRAQAYALTNCSVTPPLHRAVVITIHLIQRYRRATGVLQAYRRATGMKEPWS
jgi:hypothetical protein